MTCVRIGGAIVCYQPFYRLRLQDGTCVFMEWHSYLGPTFYRDRKCNRIWEDWYDNPLVCGALDWFTHRGNKA